MCVCSRLTRAGTSPAARCGSKSASSRGIHPSASRGPVMLRTIPSSKLQIPIRLELGIWSLGCGVAWLSPLSAAGAYRDPRGRGAPSESTGLVEAAQHFRYAPGLGNTSSCSIRSFGVEDLADRPDAGFRQVLLEPVQELTCALAVLRIGLQPGVHEGANQPRPDGTLVIGRVPRPEIPVVLRLVIAMSRGERPQADRSDQPIANDLQHRLPSLAVQDRMVERNCQHLVGPAGWIVAGFAIDHVVQIPAVEPEPPVERLARPPRVTAWIEVGGHTAK